MKRVFLFVFLLFGLAISSVAQSATITTEKARLLGTPSTTGMVVQFLPKGTHVSVLREDATWILVQSAEYVGWIHRDMVQLDSTSRPITYTTRDGQYARPLSEPVKQTSASEKSTGADKIILVPIIVEKTPSVASETRPELTRQIAVADPLKPPTGKCKDGSETTASEKEEACSENGGLDQWFADVTTVRPTYTPSSSPSRSTGGPVQVKGYTRKDGTYVAPHTRKSPRRKP